MESFRSEQEAFWAGTFGNEYVVRNDNDNIVAVNTALFGTILRHRALKTLLPENPEEVRYRGHEGKLFKRDFAGEMLARFPQLSLVAYGFAYRHDRAFPMDDLSWFLMEKPNA